MRRASALSEATLRELLEREGRDVPPSMSKNALVTAVVAAYATSKSPEKRGRRVFGAGSGSSPRGARPTPEAKYPSPEGRSPYSPPPHDAAEPKPETATSRRTAKAPPAKAAFARSFDDESPRQAPADPKGPTSPGPRRDRPAPAPAPSPLQESPQAQHPSSPLASPTPPTPWTNSASAASAAPAASASAPDDGGGDSDDDSGIMPEPVVSTGAGFVGNLRARARGSSRGTVPGLKGMGPIHIPATNAPQGGEVQSEVDFWVQGAKTHATPREAAQAREAPPPQEATAGAVADGAWFWG